ncbi:MAG TPA: hypothetical protein VKQ34_01735 [Candidatus Saccharimonadales bacterium]|nr:hypothetical protein [Candidatus Saccharimonadales bacterium]
MRNPLRRSRGQEGAGTPQAGAVDTRTPAEVGADVLREYRHPDSWIDGGSTGKPHLLGRMVLLVEEIRLGGKGFVTPEQALSNAAAIRAWAGSVGLAPYLTFDRQPDNAPYVVVPEQYFQEPVLPQLQALAQPPEQA